jgi:MarR family transcriptional regulator, organic hydroperoxide resistance regulator
VFVNSDDCIFFQLAKANQLAGKFLGQKVAELSVTPVQALALGFLNEEDQITASELGRKTELDSATLTGILDRLETARLIQRRNNPDDRRSILIHLTERGKTVGAEAARLIVEANQEFLRDLTEEERHVLHAMIRKLRRQALKI